MFDTQNILTQEILDTNQWIFFWDDYMGEENQ